MKGFKTGDRVRLYYQGRLCPALTGVIYRLRRKVWVTLYRTNSEPAVRIARKEVYGSGCFPTMVFVQTGPAAWRLVEDEPHRGMFDGRIVLEREIELA